MSNRQKPKRWTDDENKVLLRYVEANPHNLSRCFLMVAEHLDRTPSSVAAHWYTKLSKDPDVLLYATISAHHVAKNRKNGLGVESNPTIWRRVVRIIKSLFQ